MTARIKKHTLGIDIGGTKIYTLIVDDQNNIVGRGKKKSGDGSPKSMMDRMSSSVNDALLSANLTMKSIRCVGIGFPGPLNPRTGVILQATNLPALSGFHLAEEAKAVFGCPVFVDNDVNLGTFGEAILGAGDGAQNVVGIFLGTGVGGGIILNGRIYHGANGTAGEIGHMIIQHGGIVGPFGLRGSVEGLTSRLSIMNRIRSEIKKGKKSVLEPNIKSGKRIGSALIANAYRGGDSVVQKALHRAARYVGVVSGSIINLLCPEVVVLGGGVVSAVPEAIIPLARQMAAKIILESNRESCRIEEAALGDDAGALGAVVYARQKYQDIRKK